MAQMAFSDIAHAPLKITQVFSWAVWFYVRHPVLWLLSLAPMVLRATLVMYADELGTGGLLVLEVLTELARVVIIATIAVLALKVGYSDLLKERFWRTQYQKLQKFIQKKWPEGIWLAIGMLVIFLALDRLLGWVITGPGALSILELLGNASITTEEARTALILIIKNFIIIPLALLYMLRAVRIVA